MVDDAGNVIAYTVSEEPVEGYETTIEGSNITNTRTPEVVERQNGHINFPWKMGTDSNR